MSDCQNRPTFLPEAVWKALMNLPALRYMKAPVNTEAELYEKYPTGNDKGAFAFVHNENTFYTYHPRGWNCGEWKPIAGGIESFFEIDAEFLKEGDILVYDSNKKKFVVKSGNVWNRLLGDLKDSFVQVTKFLNQVSEVPTDESDSGVYFVHKDEEAEGVLTEFRALYIVLGKKAIKIWNSSDYYTAKQVQSKLDKKANQKQVDDIAASVDVLNVTKAEKSVVDALSNGIRKQKAVATYNTGANSLSAVYGLTQGDSGTNAKAKQNGWDVLVEKDETKGGKSNRYNWNGEEWVDMLTGNYSEDVATKNDLSHQSGNLFTNDGAIGKATGITGEAPAFLFTDLIPINPFSKIELQAFDDGALSGCYFYDEHGKPISPLQFLTTGTQTIVIDSSNKPDDAVFFRATGKKTEKFSIKYLSSNDILREMRRQNAITDSSIADINTLNTKLKKELFVEKGDKNVIVTPFVGYMTHLGEYEDYATVPNFIYRVSDYERVIENKKYQYDGALSGTSAICFFDANKVFISSVHSMNAPSLQLEYIIPNNAVYVRYTLDTSLANQIIVTYLDEDNVEIIGQIDNRISKLEERSTPIQRITLHQSFLRWMNGEKFPLVIIGDSTVDGVSTTGWSSHGDADAHAGGIGKFDHKPPNAFTTLLEKSIRNYTNNNTMRVYNAGYSGTDIHTYKNNIRAMLSGVYSDAKIAGIQYGINDRLMYNSLNEYTQAMIVDLSESVDTLLDMGIQPFLCTTQSTLEPSPADGMEQYSLRYSGAIHVAVNEAVREVANKYNLEIVDVNQFTSMFMRYSDYSLNDIISDTLHFNDLGHKFESDLYFACLCPQTIFIDNEREVLLDYTSQKYTSEVKSLVYFEKDADGFKCKAKLQGLASEIKLIEFVVFVSANKFSLKLFDDVDVYVNDTLVVDNHILSVGLHRITIKSGNRNDVEFKGIKMTLL